VKGKGAEGARECPVEQGKKACALKVELVAKPGDDKVNPRFATTAPNLGSLTIFGSSYLNPHLHHPLPPCAAAHLGILCFAVSSSAVSLPAHYTRTKALLQVLLTDQLPSPRNDFRLP
jgi:hypothetical protein